jgi:hypothetical protein
VGESNDVAGDFYLLDWMREVDTHEAYITALDFVVNFYNSNVEFRLDTVRSTAKVLGKDTTSSDESGSGKMNFVLLLI